MTPLLSVGASLLWTRGVRLQKLIIDGYNVIHADPELKAAFSASIESARARLVEWIRAYLEHKRVQVTLVFDGRGGITDAEVLVPGRFQVLYSASCQTADDFIVDTLFTHPNPREFIVVTSDRADIGSRVSSVGAAVLSSAEFLARLSGPAGDPAGEGDEEAPMSQEDMDFWLKQFGKGKSQKADD